MAEGIASAARPTWFDLSSPYRTPLNIPGGSRCGLWSGSIELAEGRCRSTAEWIVATQTHVAFEVAHRAANTHPDGSLKRVPFAVALPGGFDPASEGPVHVYYGGASRCEAGRLVDLSPTLQAARAVAYDVDWDDAAEVRRLVLHAVRRDLLAEGLRLGPAVLNSSGWCSTPSTPANSIELRRVAPGTLRWVTERRIGGCRCLAEWTFLPAEIRVRMSIDPRSDTEILCPWTISHPAGAGYVIAPDESRFDPTHDAATRWSGAPLPFPGYALSGQGGYVVTVTHVGETPAPDTFVAESDGTTFTIRIGCAIRNVGQRVVYDVRWIPAPFCGPPDLDYARVIGATDAGPGSFTGRPEERRAGAWAPRVESRDGRAIVSCLGLRCDVAPCTDADSGRLALHAGDVLLYQTDPICRVALDDGAEFNIPVRRVSLVPGGLHLGGYADSPAAWRMESFVVPRLVDGVVVFEESRRVRAPGPSPDARLSVAVRTAVGAPDWTGPRAVVVPGSFTRLNYAPGQPHGGGPKWGPSTDIAAGEGCKHEQGGYADNWSFAASRLPLVWAAAADSERKIGAWIGTEPSTKLGETSAGFRAPAGHMTTLELHTPTCYQPRVPIGYGGFSDGPLLGTAPVSSTRDTLWRIYYGGWANNDLAGWAPYDRALYRLSGAHRLRPYKMRLDQGLALICDALVDRFYDPARRVLTYGTGPEARWAPIGFTGMAHGACALAEAGARIDNPRWRSAGLAVLDHVAEAFLTGPEFPFASWDGERWTHGSSEPGYVILCALDALLTALDWEERRGQQRDGWREASLRCCNAWVRHQHEDGRYPHRHPAMGSDNADYDSTNVEAGVAGCLAYASRLFRRNDYLESAQRAAARYAEDLSGARLYGGPGDIEALVNSEAPMWFLRAYAELHRADPRPEWLALARTAAAWRFSSQFAHEWPADFGTPLCRQGWSGLGCEGASASNVHAVCYGALNLRDYQTLSKATGDPYVLDRARDLARYCVQQFGRWEGDVDILGKGLGTESFWATESRWGKGGILILPQLGFMSWVIGWAGLGILFALEWPEVGDSVRP